MSRSDELDEPSGGAAYAGTLTLGLVALAWNIQRSSDFFADDALISLRYAARLIQGQGLTWTDGERVEGYSNLLWILLVSIPGALGVDLVHAAIGLGLVCAAGVVVLTGHLLRPAGRWATMVGVLAMALSAPLGAWAIGGLEGPLHTLLVLGAVACLVPAPPRLVGAGLLLGLACWTRPDTPLLVAALAAGTWLATGQDLAALRRAAIVAGVPAAFVAVQVAVRLWYYGDWVPNTAHAKVDGASLDRGELGVLYILPWLRAGGWLWVLALPGLFLPPARFRWTSRLLLPVLGVQLAWLVRVGGDHFAGWRLLLVLEPLRAVLACLGVAAVAARLGRWAPVTGVVGAGVLAWFVRAQEAESAIALLRVQERWEWAEEPIGRLLGEAFPARPLVATCAAGGIPFWSGLPALDPLGLTDRHIARERLHPDHVGIPGHEAADTAYVVGRRPDIVVICSPVGGDVPCLPQEAELLAHPEVRERYVVRWLRGTKPFLYTSGPLFRVDSAALGVREDGSEWWIPGWFWADDREAPAEQVDGRLVLRRPAGNVAVLPILPVEGAWVARPETEPPGAASAVLRDGGVDVAFSADATLVGVRLERAEVERAEGG